MTLEEAIKHCEEVAKECKWHIYRYPDQLAYKEKFYDAEKCAEEHRQLAEWLKELKIIHEIIDDMKDSEEIFVGYLRKKIKEKMYE